MKKLLSIFLDDFTVNNILYFFLPLTSFYMYALDLVFSGDIYLLIAVVLSFPYFVTHVLHKNNTNNLKLLLLAMLVFGTFNMINTQNGIGGLVVMIGHFSLAVFCINNIKKIKWHILVILIFYSAFILYNVLVLEIDNRYIFEELGLSRNHGGGVLLILSSFFCFSFYISYNKVPFIIPLLVIWPAYLCAGRSSIAASLFLALICFVLRNNWKASLVFIVSLMGVILYFWEDLSNFYELSTFAEKGTESEREYIWKSYFDNMDIVDIILGPDTLKFPVINSYEGNPHNAFLNMHRRFGLFVCIIFFFILIKSVTNYFKRYPIILSCIFFCICFRAFFDSIFFVGRLDFLFLGILYYAIIIQDINNKRVGYNIA